MSGSNPPDSRSDWPLPHGDSHAPSQAAPPDGWNTRGATADGAAGPGPVTPTPVVGALFLHYRLEEELGRGAFGTVYRATDVRLGRSVAVKILRKAADRPRERFLREGKILSRLRHPNLPEIHEAAFSGGHFYQVQEYLTGETLEALSPLPARRAAEVLRDVAAAVQHAHEADVIHRDIKPANILITSERAFLLDFGVAYDRELSGLTQDGEGVGTVAFASPEQLTGRKVGRGNASDVYGLGATLFAALTGLAPHESYEQPILAMLQGKIPPPPSAIKASVPAALDAICARCLAREPGKRYASASDVADELNDFLDASEDGQREAAPWHAPAAFAVFALILGGLAAALWTALSDVRPPPGGKAVGAKTSEASAAQPKGSSAQAVERALAEAAAEARALRSYSTPLRLFKQARRAASKDAALLARVNLCEFDYLRRRGRWADALQGLSSLAASDSAEREVARYLIVRVQVAMAAGAQSEAAPRQTPIEALAALARPDTPVGLLATAALGVLSEDPRPAEALPKAPPADLHPLLRGEWSRVRGEGALLQGKQPLAFEAFALAKEATPDDAWILARVGALSLRRGRESGLKDLSRAVALCEPAPPPAWLRRLGLEEAKRRRLELAWRDLSRVTSPADGEVAFWLGVTHARIEESDDAELEILVRDAPPPAEAWAQAWRSAGSRVEGWLQEIEARERPSVRAARE